MHHHLCCLPLGCFHGFFSRVRSMDFITFLSCCFPLEFVSFHESITLFMSMVGFCFLCLECFSSFSNSNSFGNSVARKLWFLTLILFYFLNIYCIISWYEEKEKDYLLYQIEVWYSCVCREVFPVSFLRRVRLWNCKTEFDSNCPGEIPSTWKTYFEVIEYNDLSRLLCPGCSVTTKLIR